MRVLYFSNNQVSDISVLKELKNLEILDFSKNQVSNISVLQELKNLKHLNFFGNQVSDISILKELKNLESLDFSENQVSDISILKELKNLDHLNFSNNQVTDISVLKELKNLINLNFYNNLISDVSVLAELKNLKWLTFSHNQVSDISVLKELKNITILFFSNNQVSDISALKELKNLEVLEFSFNQVSKFPYFLKNLPNIKFIHFLPNPYQFQFKNHILDLLIKNESGIDFNNISSFKLICEITEKETQQKTDQSEWINLKIPKDFERIFSQYLLLFKDFVAVVKGKVIECYLRPENESWYLVSYGNTNINQEQIRNYLEEYVALLSKNLKKDHLFVENRDIELEKVRREMDLFILRHENQVANLNNEIRILEIERKDLQKDIEKLSKNARK